MSFSVIEAIFVGTVLEGLFYGLYCIVFILYLRVQAAKCDDRSILFYPISSLLVLCTAFFGLDFTQAYLTVAKGQGDSILVWNLNLSTSVIYTLVDAIAQGVLIFRCWEVWNRRLAIVVVPTILALISLAAGLTVVGEMAILGQKYMENRPGGWFTPVGTPIGLISFSVSLALNAILTGLLVFKIAKASLFLRRTHARGMQDFTPLISIIVESGLVLFIVQLVLVISFSTESNAFDLVTGPITIIYAIIPTTILVRVTMAARSADTASNRSSVVESTMEFAFTDENLPEKMSKYPED